MMIPATRSSLLAVAVAATLLGSGCNTLSTSEVESGLQRLAFHPNMYVVQAGDSLETVAFRYAMEPSELATLNPGIAADLRPGMRINVRPGTVLSDELRANARVARGPAVSNAPRRAPVVAAAPAPAAATASPTTIVATAPARAASAIRAQPDRAPTEMVIEEARFDLATGGHPKEQVIADDLGPQPAPLAAPVAAPSGYVEVPSAPTADGGTRWVWPTVGQVARGFAPERVGGQGIDIAGAPGQDVRAAAAGTVVYSGKDPSGSGGSLVILNHGGDLMTTYSHADRLFVTEDDVVRAGDPIASLGANAQSESVLSFEVRRDGAPLDPLQFLSAP